MRDEHCLCILLNRKSKRGAAKRGFIDDGQTLIIHIENSSFDELGAEISWTKGSPGSLTGRTPWDTPKGTFQSHLEENASHHMVP